MPLDSSIDPQWSAVLEAQRAFGRIVCREEVAHVATLGIAAFDESGKLADTQFVVFAGSISTPEQWQFVSVNWNAVLQKSGIQYLSMKEAMHCRGQFLKWKDRLRERDALLVSLAEMFHQSIALHVAAPIDSNAFKALPHEARRLLKNPVYCGFQACVHGLMAAVQNPAMKIALQCDSSEEYAVQCLRLYLKMRAHDAEFKNRCVSITFSEDQHYPPLQAADMLAYCVRQDHTRQTVKPPRVVDDLLAVFNRDGIIHGSLDYHFHKA